MGTVDITQGEDEKVVEEQAICLESKVMNPNDEDCCDEEGEDEGTLSNLTNSNKGIEKKRSA